MKHRYTPKHRAVEPTAHRWPSRQGLVVLSTAAVLLATATPASAADITIPRGATLWGIAATYCGTGAKYMDLARGNGIANPARIYAGAKLHLTCTTPVRPASPTASRSTTRTTPAWVHPLPSGRSSSCYGPRAGGYHYGTDFAAGAGTPIRAAHAGTVARVAYEGDGAGHYVVLSHGDGVFTAYFHMIRRSPLGVGQTVQAGQTIGNVGETGDATGPHLHFEVHQGGIFHKTNPAVFMRAHGVGMPC